MTFSLTVGVPPHSSVPLIGQGLFFSQSLSLSDSLSIMRMAGSGERSPYIIRMAWRMAAAKGLAALPNHLRLAAGSGERSPYIICRPGTWRAPASGAPT
jgi:hypothetical protein